MGGYSESHRVKNGGVPLGVDRPIRIEGSNSDVHNDGTWQDVTEAPLNVDGTIIEPNTLGENISVISSSVLDSINGVGAQRVRVEYINTSNKLVYVDIDLNGTNQVYSSITDMRSIIDLYAILVGSAKLCQGNVDVVDSLTGLKVYNRILAGGNKAQSSFREFLPTSTVYLTGMVVSSLTKGLEVELRITANDSGDIFIAPDVYLYQLPIITIDSSQFITFNPALVVPASAKMKVSVRTDLSPASHKVKIWLNGWVKI